VWCWGEGLASEEVYLPEGGGGEHGQRDGRLNRRSGEKGNVTENRKETAAVRSRAKKKLKKKKQKNSSAKTCILWGVKRSHAACGRGNAPASRTRIQDVNQKALLGKMLRERGV